MNKNTFENLSPGTVYKQIDFDVLISGAVNSELKHAIDLRSDLSEMYAEKARAYNWNIVPIFDPSKTQKISRAHTPMTELISRVIRGSDIKTKKIEFIYRGIAGDPTAVRSILEKEEDLIINGNDENDDTNENRL